MFDKHDYERIHVTVRAFSMENVEVGHVTCDYDSVKEIFRIISYGSSGVICSELTTENFNDSARLTAQEIEYLIEESGVSSGYIESGFETEEFD